jgi:hypothetical protein
MEHIQAIPMARPLANLTLVIPALVIPALEIPALEIRALVDPASVPWSLR